MKYVIICDESYTNGRYFVLGSLILPRHNHSFLAAELNEWKSAHKLNPNSEFKWKKVSRKYLPRYTEMMEWFFRHLRANHLRFRSLVMDTRDANYRQFSENERDTGFYKAYYHLLLQSIKQMWAVDPGERVLILLDERRDRYPFHREILAKTLNAALKRDFGVPHAVSSIEPRVSSGPKGEVLIQAVDVLVGAIGFVRNGSRSLPSSSDWKLRLVEVIEREAGSPLSFDTMVGSPFNIWTFDLCRAMERKKDWKKARTKRKRPQA